MNCWESKCRKKATVELPFENGNYCDKHKEEGWKRFIKDWEAFQKDPTCGYCGKLASPEYMFMGDPFTEEIYPEEDAGCQHWCQKCYETRKEDI